MSEQHDPSIPAEGQTGGSFLPVILVIFFLSGACGLVYEVVWLKTLSLVFGVTALAAATTLASFMAGLGLGSYYFGRLADGVRRPLRLYGALELGIALFAFLMPVIFSGLDNIYIFIYRQWTTSFFWLSLSRLVLSFAVLLIPTILMGGTLPVISRFLVRRSAELGRRVSQLYAINTLGAVLGATAAGFFLIYFIGIKEAAYAAGIVNALIALAAFILDRRQAGAAVPVIQAKPEADAATESETPLPPRQSRLVLWAIGISGFCSLAYEVLWTRSLVYILDNTAQAFTTMLTAFLLGIALGSLVVSRWLDRGRRLIAAFGIIELAIGFLALLSIPVFGNLGAAIGSVGAGDYYPTASQTLWAFIRFGRSLAVMLLPTLLMGMTIPLATRIYARSHPAVGSAIGRVYAANTIGGVAGSFAAALALLPLLGVYGSLMLIAALNAAVGLSLIMAGDIASYVNKLKTAAISALPFIIALAVLLAQGRVVFSSTVEQAYPYNILYYREGAAATVKVYQDVFAARTLSIDGFPVAGTTTRHLDAQKSLGHLPLLINQVDSPRLNIIGFGAGGSSWAATLYDTSAIDVVELVPDVISAARLIPGVNHGVMDDPDVNIITDDGRNYLLLTEKQYDVISVDATSPKSAGSGSLYSLQFYQSCQSHLSENGLMVEWLPYHLMTEDDVKMVVRTFQGVFPHATLWYSLTRHYYLLVGTQQELKLDFERLQALVADPDIQAELAPMGITDAYDVLACFLMDETTLAAYAAEGALNTDDHPRLEYDPGTTYLNVDEHVRQNLNATRPLRQSVWSYIYNFGDADARAIKLTLDERMAASAIERFWPQYIE